MKTITLTLLVLLAALACVASVSVAKDDWRRREKYEDKYEERYDRRDRQELHGLVESLPENSLEGTWVVGGREVYVTRDTAIDQEHGRITVGSFVEVKGSRAGKVIQAWRIERK